MSSKKLSRDGGLGRPKLGLLDYMLRSFDPEGERDLVFVPVGVNLDRTLEDRSLLMSAHPDLPAAYRAGPIRGTLRFLAHNMRLLLEGRWHRFGYACVNFGSPLSMKERLGETAIDPRRIGRDDRFAMVEELAGDLMTMIGNVIPVLPVSVVATVVLQAGEEGIGELEIKAGSFELIERLESAGAHVYMPRWDQDYAVSVGLRMLRSRHLVEDTGAGYRPVEIQLPVLSYYARSIEHLL